MLDTATLLYCIYFVHIKGQSLMHYHENNRLQIIFHHFISAINEDYLIKEIQIKIGLDIILLVYSLGNNLRIHLHVYCL